MYWTVPVDMAPGGSGVLVVVVLPSVAGPGTSGIIWATVQPDGRDSFNWTYMDRSFEKVLAAITVLLSGHDAMRS